MYSVVIPTLGLSDRFDELLTRYLRHRLVGEVIVVNNAPHRPVERRHRKLRVLAQKTNIFVNPAWNLGAARARHDRLILSNDDILFNTRLLDALHPLLTSGVGIIGPGRSCFDRPTGPPRLAFAATRGWGFGTLMVMRTDAYRPIPEDIKIWSGDNWLFHHQAAPNYRILGFPIDTRMSTTSRRPEFETQKHADKIRAQRLIPLTATYERAMAALDGPPPPIALDPGTFTSRTDQLKRAVGSLRRRVGAARRPNGTITGSARPDLPAPRPGEPVARQ